MLEKILTAYDDSEAGRAAVELTGRMASGTGARLTIAHVVRPQREDRDARSPEEEISETTRWECEKWAAKLEEAAGLARGAALEAGADQVPEVEGRILVGKAGDRLMELVEEESIDVLAAGTHGVGHVKQQLFGSLSQWLLEHAHASIDLLFTRERLPAQPAPAVLVGCDGSEWSKRAVNIGEQLANALDGPLVLTYVAGYPAPFADSAFLGSEARDTLREDLHAYGEEVIAKCREQVSTGTANVVEDVHEGHVREEMLKAVDQRYPSMAVVGTRGATGFSGLLIGSVTRDLLDYSKAPVLVVKPPESDGT